MKLTKLEKKIARKWAGKTDKFGNYIVQTRHGDISYDTRKNILYLGNLEKSIREVCLTDFGRKFVAALAVAKKEDIQDMYIWDFPDRKLRKKLMKQFRDQLEDLEPENRMLPHIFSEGNWGNPFSSIPGGIAKPAWYGFRKN